MKNYHFTALAIGIVILVLSLLNPPHIEDYFSSGVKIGQLDLKDTTVDAGLRSVRAAYTQPVYLNINNKSFSTSLNELGYKLNTNYLRDYSKTCLVYGIKLCEPEKKTDFDPSRVFALSKQKNQKFVEKFNTDMIQQINEPKVDFLKNEFWVLTPNAKVEVTDDFVKSINLAKNFGQRLLVNVTVVEKDDFTQQADLMYEHVAQVNKPLLIKYGRIPLYISTEVITSFITQKQVNEIAHANISRDKISEYLDELAREYASDQVIVIRPEADDAIARALLYRAADTETNTAVVLPLQGRSKSNGDKADAYLEVVKSQQRLYRFENGNLVKTYVISTGILAETPAGEFSVLGKQKKTISYVGNWWMENYLPIGTMPGTSNRFGFHAIPYHQDGSGTIYSRDPNTMGSPATSGCIQLTQDESLELFEWAKVGMPVFIYE